MEPGGTRHDCTLAPGAKAVETFDSVPGGTIGLSEGLAVFSTVADGPVAKACFDHDRVFDRTGKMSGWLSFRIC